MSEKKNDPDPVQESIFVADSSVLFIVIFNEFLRDIEGVRAQS